MSARDDHDGLRARVDAAIGNLDAAIVELGEHLEQHEAADAERLERLRDCVVALRGELDAVVVRVAELERRLEGRP